MKWFNLLTLLIMQTFSIIAYSDVIPENLSSGDYYIRVSTKKGNSSLIRFEYCIASEETINSNCNNDSGICQWSDKPDYCEDINTDGEKIYYQKNRLSKLAKQWKNEAIARQGLGTFICPIICTFSPRNMQQTSALVSKSKVLNDIVLSGKLVMLKTTSEPLPIVQKQFRTDSTLEMSLEQYEHNLRQALKEYQSNYPIEK